MNTLFFRIAASLCFLAVALGAFGAHALKATLQTNGMVGVWDKAVLYHFMHAIVLLALALHPDVVSRIVSYFFFSGIILFSGSLYLLVLVFAPRAGGCVRHAFLKRPCRDPPPPDILLR